MAHDRKQIEQLARTYTDAWCSRDPARVAALRVRGLERVALHADLVMLARLSQALARARAVPLAA